MAGTTFAQLAAMAHQDYDRLMIMHQFTESDPVLRQLRLIQTKGGKQFTQRMKDDATGAAFATYSGAFTDNPLTYKEYSGFLARIIDQRSVPAPVAGALNDPAGLANHLAIHKDDVIESVCAKFRDSYIVGQPATVAIGADMTTGLGTVSIVPGARNIYSVEDVHNHTAVVPRNLGLKWVQASKLISAKFPGESSYGATATLSATNYFKVPLYNADGTKWVWFTCDYATIAGKGNFESTIATDAECAVFTPSLQMHGLQQLVHPSRRMFGNLSGVLPTATGGDSLTVKALSWMAMMLRRAAGGRPNSVILCSDAMWLQAQAVLLAAGAGGVTPVQLMDETLNELAINKVPIMTCEQMANNRADPAASTSTLGWMLGVVLGDDESGCHVRYNTVDAVEGISGMPGFQAGGSVDTGHGERIALPFTYYVVPPNSTDEQLHPRASMLTEMATAKFDALCMLDCLKTS